MNYQEYIVRVYKDRTEYYKDGKLHRNGDPAIIKSNGDQFWYQYGRYHRLAGPACEYANGSYSWWFHDKPHRIGGPAVLYSTGTKEWCFNGQLHRIEGPAVEEISGKKRWYLFGIQYSEEQFKKISSQVNKNIIVDGMEYYLHPKDVQSSIPAK